jgi:hypothetical protein
MSQTQEFENLYCMIKNGEIDKFKDGISELSNINEQVKLF